MHRAEAWVCTSVGPAAKARVSRPRRASREARTVLTESLEARAKAVRSIFTSKRHWSARMASEHHIQSVGEVSVCASELSRGSGTNMRGSSVGAPGLITQLRHTVTWVTS